MTTESRLLGGRYQLQDALGYGGMAEVHRARDTRLDRDVAIKTLRVDLARDPLFQSRFRREAQSAAALNHPSIVAVYDTGEDRSGEAPVPYIVMEYVPGQTLRDILAAEGQLPWRRALDVVARILAALDYSHRQGIVHRDIKPGNVMIDPDGRVKVMDFGIARAVAAATAALTQTATVMGTAQYLSPEQARGESVDARSDVYSTGCLLYELLTGSPPFTGDSPVAVAYQHVREDAVPPSELVAELPPVVDAIVLKAMAKNPVNRYQSAEEMRADCERALVGAPVEATPLLPVGTAATAVVGGTHALPAAAVTGVLRPDGAGSTLLRPPRRRRRRIATILLLVLACLLLLVGATLLTRMLLTNARTVVVPSVGNAQLPAAEAAIRRVGLVPRAVRQHSTQPAGTVLRQNPNGGVRVRKHAIVTLYYSVGPALATVPNVTGQLFSAAATILQSDGFTVPPGTPQDSNQPKGTVLKQNPPANAAVPPGSSVQLTVASGRNTVPSEIGVDQATANQDLVNAGFNVRTRPVLSSQTPGTVIGQDPSGGSLPLGSTVTIDVATSPPSPSPTPSPSPKPTATPTPTASPTPTTSPTPTSPSPSPSLGGVPPAAKPNSAGGPAGSSTSR